MGLSNFPSPAEGVLPVLVMNTVLSVTLFKNMVRSVLQVVSGPPEEISSNLDETYPSLENNEGSNPRRRRLSTTRYHTFCKTRYEDQQKGGSKNGENEGDGDSSKWSLMECCVCLNRFEGEEEVSELSCKHFFHKGCLEKWFDNQHTSCPLCRSIL